MKWDNLLQLVGDQPIFESGMLLAGEAAPAEVRRQLSRWTASGRLLQLRRGLYAFGHLHGKERPEPFVVAARLRYPSYVSLQSALSHYGLIPESVPVVMSATTGRPGVVETPLGSFWFRHVDRDRFWGYGEVRLEGGQSAFIASPEKALLDLVYLSPGPVSRGFLEELRLDPDGEIDPERLVVLAGRMRSRKVLAGAKRAASWIRAARSGKEGS